MIFRRIPDRCQMVMQRIVKRFSGRCRLSLQETGHSLRQLGVHLVRDQHNIWHYLAEIDGSYVLLDRLENAHLQRTRLLYEHGCGVALATSQCSMRGSRSTRPCRPVKFAVNAKTLNDVRNEFGKGLRTLIVVKNDGTHARLLLHSRQPPFNGVARTTF